MDAISDPPENTSDKGGKRQRSSIGFPYYDYGNCSAITMVIHSNVGHGECSLEQLSAWANRSSKSSGFLSQVSASKLFGIIEEGSEPGTLRLTKLGRQTLDPNTDKEAKAESFLNVPLFEALYEKYKGGVTPPHPALESEIVSLGVSVKQKTKARQVFESSAQQTGFRTAAPNRLVLPATVVKPNGDPKVSPDGKGPKNFDQAKLDPLITATLDRIPTEKPWSGKNRLRWFHTLAMNISQVYDEDENIVELEIKLLSKPASPSEGKVDVMSEENCKEE